jgi:iron complex transport system permease protein
MRGDRPVAPPQSAPFETAFPPEPSGGGTPSGSARGGPTAAMRPTRPTRRRPAGWPVILIIAVAVVASLVAAVAFGPARIPLSQVAHALLRPFRPGAMGGGVALPSPPPSWQETVIWRIRLPRALLGFLVGGSLALAGAALQGLFRNPLADPSILGVSAGASLGAVLTIFLGIAGRAVWLLPLGAFAGAALTALVVLGLAAQRGRGRIYTTTMLLVGVAVGALNVSFTTFILSVSLNSYDVGRQVLHWILGGLDGRTWDHVFLAAPAILLGAATIIVHARELDALLLGEVTAQSIGVDVGRIRLVLVLGTSLLIGAAVAAAGPIGFVGLLVPHILRLVVGATHRALLPASFLAGGLFVVLADLVARTLLTTIEIPVGVVTAAVGAPFFLILLIRRGQELSDA